MDRFSAGNASLETEYGVKLNQYAKAGSLPAGTPLLDVIFEERTADAVARFHDMSGSGDGRTLRDSISENWFAGEVPKTHAAA